MVKKQKITIQDELRKLSKKIEKIKDGVIDYKEIAEELKNSHNLVISTVTLKKYCENDLGFPTRAEINRCKREIKEKQELSRRIEKENISRRYISRNYITYDESLNNSTQLMIDGFNRCDDESLYNKVVESLSKPPSFSKIMESLADSLVCDKAEICLLNFSSGTRNGSHTPLIIFTFNYNENFNDVLRTSGVARFDGQSKCWSLAPDEDELPFLFEEIAATFSWIIDLDNMFIMKNSGDAYQAKSTPTAFSLLPYHLEINKVDIENAIREYRNDNLKPDSLFIHDGDVFIKFNDRIWSRSPFALVRYGVINGSPRYVCYSTLARSVEACFFAGSPDMKRVISRFADSKYLLKESFISENGNQLKLEEINQRSLFQGGFDRFSSEIEKVERITPELKFHPLCSDYVSLAFNHYGADTGVNLITAYVATDDKSSSFMRQVASYFSDKEYGYHIVFDRKALDDIHDQGTDISFMQLVAHEIAHWLDKEILIIQSLKQPHGVSWALIQDILEYAYTGEYIRSGFSRYADKESTIRVERVIWEQAIPAINVALDTQGFLTKEKIEEIAYLCIENF